MLQIIKVARDDKNIIRSVIENFIETADRESSFIQLEKFLSDDRTHLFSALYDDEVIGYALAYSFPSMSSPGYLAYLYDIEVLKDQRRKGIGRLIMESLLVHLKSLGISEMWLGTATDNSAAQGLFSATGGIKSGETFNDFTYDLTFHP